MTLLEAYRDGTARLAEAGIADAHLDAWYLLDHVTGISRAMYYVRQNETMPEPEWQKYAELIRKRAGRIPLQHITGQQEFMGLVFAVNEHVLVPRQDTEVLVETVQQYLRSGMDILDLCTGSGCILVSLCKCPAAAYDATTLRGTGSDISKEALRVAEENAKNHGVDVALVQSDLFEQIAGIYDVIVSNPPYIPTKEIEELEEEVRLHDPMLALDGREDGLYFYRKITEESPSHLKDGGMLFFEIGCDQAEAVSELMREAGFAQVKVKKDLAGLDRVVFGVYNISGDVSHVPPQGEKSHVSDK